MGSQLTAIADEAFSSGEAGEAWEAALAALPAYLQLRSAVFTFKTQGKLPEELFVSAGRAGRLRRPGAGPVRLERHRVELPAGAGARRPVGGGGHQPPEALALFQAPRPPLAYTLLEPGQTLSPAAAEAANAVLLGGVLAQAEGTLTGQLPGVALDQATPSTPLFAIHPRSAPDPAALLADRRSRAGHLQTLLSFVISGGYDGVALDYTGLAPELGPGYAQFVHDLAAQLHSQGKSLFVQVEAPELTGDALSTAGYDWRALGAAADAVFVPLGDDPTVFGGGLAESVLGWAVGEVPRGRLRLMTTALSVESVDGQFALIDQEAALAPLGSVSWKMPRRSRPVSR